MIDKCFFDKERAACPIRTGITMFILCIVCVLLFSGCAELTGTDDLQPNNTVVNQGDGTLVFGNGNEFDSPFIEAPEPTPGPAE